MSIVDYEENPEIKEFIDKFEDEEMKNIETKGQLFPMYFNAWEYDSNEDPLITLIYSISIKILILQQWKRKRKV